MIDEVRGEKKNLVIAVGEGRSCTPNSYLRLVALVQNLPPLITRPSIVIDHDSRPTMSMQKLSAQCRPSLIHGPISANLIPVFCCRHQSTYRRARKALKIKPDPSFLPSKTETQDHIILNPPSSAPNVYHTPLKFLPADDPRRQMHTLLEKRKALLSSKNPQPVKASSLQPVRPVYEKKYHVQSAQIDEIRKLRAEDPVFWTRIRLADKFKCSQFFISLCCNSPEMAARHQRELELVKARWGRKRTEAREDRVERKKLWGRDA